MLVSPSPPGRVRVVFGVGCMSVSLAQWEYNINNVSVGGCPCSMCQCSSRVIWVGRDDRALLMTYGKSNKCSLFITDRGGVGGKGWTLSR